MGIFNELLANKILIAGITGWASAQVIKAILYTILNKEFRLERLFGDGGMPSGHSATVSAMAMMSLLHYGIGSFEFAISTMIAIIVMHDAMGVRLETGKQAEVINELTALFEEIANDFNNEDSWEKKFQKVFSEDKLKEYVGHTPIQVIAGCLLGLIVGWVLH
ncbi:MAG: divergent PAP2 family protein [Lachnospiraceae bacterium]|nr:divergent PAP2 family protein [Lachnospiraceae bacterium]